MQQGNLRDQNTAKLRQQSRRKKQQKFSEDLIKASPYTKLFWNEYQLDPNRNDYNIVFDQTIHGNLDVEKLTKSLYCVINDLILFNSHLVSIDNILYWEKLKF